MTGEKIISCNRMGTGDQHFVFEVITASAKYVIRMTDFKHRNNFISAIYWQDKLLPLHIPLATFIQRDLDGRFSPFPTLLMRRLPGDDLINVYASLSATEKRFLAREMVKIQSATSSLPNGSGYGFASSYEQTFEFQSWYDFLIKRLERCVDFIKKTGVFNVGKIQKIFLVAKKMEQQLRAVPARPFMWDTSERNVIIHHGNIRHCGRRYDLFWRSTFCYSTYLCRA